MKEDMPKPQDEEPTLRICDESKVEASNEDEIQLENERKQRQKQAEAEDFWAGRNLGDRQSARFAA